ncbi:MAG: hypothetical protein M3340_05315 [Actinomycetota bacterium]|nr:hypothetical protein [Actinomycetota bacterium]
MPTRTREILATIVAIGGAALIGAAVGGNVGLLIVANVTALAALFWVLSADPISKRLPYRIVRSAGPEITPEMLAAFSKGRQALRTLRRRLRGKIREGTELLEECNRAASGFTTAAPPVLFGFGGLGARVETWTKSVEKLLEIALDRYGDEFHEACLAPVGQNVITDEQRLAEMMETRVAMLQLIVEQMEKDAP